MTLDKEPTRPAVTNVDRSDVSNTVRLTLSIPYNLLYLQGHFPDFPIVPGVALSDWAIEFAGEYFDRRGDLAGLRKIKFHQVIRPNDIVILELSEAGPPNTTDFSYVSSKGAHASGRLLWL